MIYSERIVVMVMVDFFFVIGSTGTYQQGSSSYGPSRTYETSEGGLLGLSLNAECRRLLISGNVLLFRL